MRTAKLTGAYASLRRLARCSQMRLFLPALLLALAACASDPSPPSPDAPAPPAGPAFTVAVDSLRRDEPARSYRVAIAYPQIHGSSGTPLAATLRAVNAVIRDTVAAFADDVRPEAPPPGADPPRFPVRVDGTTTTTWLSDDVFSALVDLYVDAGGAHGATYVLPLTFDLATGAAVAPADLFAAGTPWADTLAAIVERGVRRQLAPEQFFVADGLDRLREGDAALTLGPDSLTVHVAQGQVSSTSAGAFHIGVPRSAVADFARPGGLLARDVQSPPAPPRRTLPGD